jgi:hypothetical protein
MTVLLEQMVSAWVSRAVDYGRQTLTIANGRVNSYSFLFRLSVLIAEDGCSVAISINDTDPIPNSIMAIQERPCRDVTTSTRS